MICVLKTEPELSARAISALDCCHLSRSTLLIFSEYMDAVDLWTETERPVCRQRTLLSPLCKAFVVF